MFVYFSSIFFPFMYGFIFLPFFGSMQDVIESFLSAPCFLLALATNFVSLSFSYAFRSKDVRHVVLHTKIPELILPFFLLSPFFAELQPLNVFSWKHCIPLLITWASFIPYFLNGNHKRVLFDKSSLFISTTLLFQMLISLTFRMTLVTLKDLLVFTMAILLWRCILSLVLLGKKKEPFKMGTLSTSILVIIGIRGFVALATQFTFNWAIMAGHPLLVWPILNTTLIVSSLASQFFLKEKMHISDWIALSGLFASSCLAKII